MKTLFLWVKGKGWRSFRYESIDDIRPELEKRNIIISSDNVQLGNNVHIGDRVVLGSNVTIGDDIVIGNDSTINDNIIISVNTSYNRGISPSVHDAIISTSIK